MKNVFFLCAVLVALCAVCEAAPSANDGITYRLYYRNGATEEVDVDGLIKVIEGIECGPEFYMFSEYENEDGIIHNSEEKSQFAFCHRFLENYKSHKCPHLRGCAVMPKHMAYPDLRVTSSVEEKAYTHNHVFTDSETNVHTLWKAEHHFGGVFKWGCVPVSRTI
eukprot:Nk52_evm7s726 gene=Nk52_evmTU7s726